MRINAKMNKVLLFIVSVLAVAVSTDDPCSNDNLIFSRENFEVYRDNIDAVNLGLPICSQIPNSLDQIKLTISVTTLSGVINLNISDNVKSLIIDKRDNMNITIDATNVMNIDRLELRSEANWFLLNTTTDFFSDFPRLTHLVAENIILRDLPTFSLSNTALTRIQVLKSNFTDSDFVQVNRTFVSGLSGLKLLWWQNSEISTLSSDAFDGLNALTELNLENNTLTNINPDQFGNTSLLELDLSHNELTTSEVVNNAFRGLSTLTYLAINSNPNFAPSILFHPLNSLREIYIQNNMYTQLDFTAFEQKENLTEIHLVGDNMFFCGCDTTFWMFFVSNSFNINFFGGDCETPIEDSGISVTNMALYNCTQRFSYLCFQGHTCMNEQVCVDTLDSFRCECTGGLRNATDPITGADICVDIDECNATNTELPCQQICINNVGSFTCACNAGFNVNGTDDTRCVDIDECDSSPQPCEEDGVPNEDLCRNNIGSFICVCRSGFNNQANPTNCTDINECDSSNNDCNQTCVNIPGDYNCTCRLGFQFNFNGTRVLEFGNSTTGNKGVPCVDEDECSTNNMCEQNCSNTFGSFICSCNQGYNLTNVTRCVNINECELNSTLCDLERGMRCNDTIGSFECICLLGHVLDSMDNTTCVPILVILPIAVIAGTSSVAVFVIGAIIIAVVIILIYLVWIRSRRSAKLRRKDSKEKVFQDDQKYELPEIVIDPPLEDAKTNEYDEVGPAVAQESDSQANRDLERGEGSSESKEAEESERKRKKESAIDDGSTSVLLNNEDIPATEPEETPKYRDVLV